MRILEQTMGNISSRGICLRGLRNCDEPNIWKWNWGKNEPRDQHFVKYVYVYKYI